MAYQSEIEKLEARFREKPEQWFAALADQYRKAGDVDMALELLNAWIDKRPNYTSGYIVMGRCLLDQDRLGDAAHAFESVLRLDMENVIALQSLSEIAERRGDLDGARTWLNRLLDADPMNDEAREALENLGRTPAEAATPAESWDVAESDDTGPPATVEDSPQPEVAQDVEAALDIERTSEAYEPFGAGSDDAQSTADLLEQPESAVWQPWDAGEPPASDEREDRDAREALEPPEAPEVAETAELVQEQEHAVDDLGAEEPPAAAEPLEGAEPARHAPPMEPEPRPVEGLVSAEAEQPETEPAPVEGLEPAEFGEASAESQPVEGLEPSVFETVLDESEPSPLLADESAGAEPPAEDRPEPSASMSWAEPAGEDAGVPSADVPYANADEVQPGLEESGMLDLEATDDVQFVEQTRTPAELEPEDRGDREPEETPVADVTAEEDHRELPIILPEEVAPELDEPGVREPAPVVTETMAELYLAQGLYAEARDIYGKLLDQNPGSERIRNRLAEVVEQAAGAKADSAPGGRERYSAVARRSLSVADLMRRLATGEEPRAGPESAVSGPEPAGSGSAFSFDEYFGGSTEPPGSDAAAGEPERPADDGEADGPQDEDFRDWLRGLKT